MPESDKPDLPWALPRPIALVGYGVEGRETLRYLLAHGVSDVTVFDRSLDPATPPSPSDGMDATFVSAGDWSGALRNMGTVVRSPGVRPDHPALEAARNAETRITSATALFLEACPGPVIGVTGTLGKGTTVSLIEAALNAEGIPCRVGGNIGTNPLAFLADLDRKTVSVLELSSFQLMGLEGTKPHVAVLLRTGEEHLDWHHDLVEYHRAKQGVLASAGSGQRVIYCADSEGSRIVAGKRAEGAWVFSRLGPVQEGIGIESGRVARFRAGTPSPLPSLDRLTLPGPFNLENVAAAALSVEAISQGGLRGPGFKAGLEALASFAGLPHRLEAVGSMGGISCFNDSYATRPDATIGAISSFDEPLSLILGGSEKHADFTILCDHLCRHPSLRRIVLIGATAERLEQALGESGMKLGGPPEIVRADSLPSAFAAARSALTEGGVLLFSPACASFDMFPNYKVRGERFVTLVQDAAREMT